MTTLPVVAKQDAPGTSFAQDPGADEELRREGLILRLARCMALPGDPPFDSDLQALEAVSNAVQRHAPWNGKAVCDCPFSLTPVHEAVRTLSHEVAALHGLAQAVERMQAVERFAAECQEREAALRAKLVAVMAAAEAVATDVEETWVALGDWGLDIDLGTDPPSPSHDLHARLRAALAAEPDPK